MTANASLSDITRRTYGRAAFLLMARNERQF
jgi:hypothetical protein